MVVVFKYLVTGNPHYVKRIYYLSGFISADNLL